MLNIIKTLGLQYLFIMSRLLQPRIVVRLTWFRVIG